jgi:hypothetical protein
MKIMLRRQARARQAEAIARELKLKAAPQGALRSQ